MTSSLVGSEMCIRDSFTFPLLCTEGLQRTCSPETVDPSPYFLQADSTSRTRTQDSSERKKKK
eukprot:7277160-Prorocentrum_lima.AAC.1